MITATLQANNPQLHIGTTISTINPTTHPTKLQVRLDPEPPSVVDAMVGLPRSDVHLLLTFDHPREALDLAKRLADIAWQGEPATEASDE